MTTPQVVFPSRAYRLSGEQEREMIEYIVTRIEALERELGRDVCRDDEWWNHDHLDTVKRHARTFMGRRQLYENTYENEVDWRARRFEGIFTESNWTVPISRRIVMQQTARANAHFFGSDPWLAVDAEGAKAPDMAKSADRWVKYKFRQAKVRHRLEQSVEKTFVRGESVMKRTHKRLEDLFQSEKE